VLYQRYYQVYLQSEEAPRLDGRSWELANKLHHVLLRLFHGKAVEVQHNSQELVGAANADRKMSLSNSVRLLLFQIFKEAHEVCLLMQKHPLGYDISFPAWPERYVAEEMRTLGRQLPHPEGRVCVCVSPRISDKDSLQTIVEASVSLM